MNKSRFTRAPRAAALIALGVGCAVAAPAFARDHVSVSIGVGLPGLSVGYSDYGHYRHEGYGHRHHGYGYRPAYAGAVYYAAPAYYRPPPRVVYYEAPVVVERPVYVRRGYETRVVYRDEGRYRHQRRDRYDDDDD
jgi:hypothetical protein